MTKNYVQYDFEEPTEAEQIAAIMSLLKRTKPRIYKAIKESQKELEHKKETKNGKI